MRVNEDEVTLGAMRERSENQGKRMNDLKRIIMISFEILLRRSLLTLKRLEEKNGWLKK